MKKLLGIVIAIVAILTMVTPTFAADVGTSVTISGGSGGEPLVIAKWETPDANPGDNVPPTQINPPVAYQGTVPIEFWAIVYDNPITDISVVAVDVFHPEGYPLEGSFKFQVILDDYNNGLDGGINAAEAQAVIDLYNAANAAGLVTVNSGTEVQTLLTIESIVDLLAQGEAYLWHGAYVMDYHQPAGIYEVEAYAIDTGAVQEVSTLENQFEYVAVTGFELDFTAINYGSVTTAGFVSGNNTFSPGDSAPTMRNIGNTWLTLQIRQDDMGFGFSSPGTNWNVSFSAQLGSLTDFPQNGGSPVNYDPSVAKVPGLSSLGTNDGWYAIPGTVHLCNTWKMDFDIVIEKAILESYSGLLQIRALSADFTGPNVPHPGT